MVKSKEFDFVDNNLDDSILLNDSTDLIYNYDGKRIFLLNIIKNNNNNLNKNTNNSILPYGILH